MAYPIPSPSDLPAAQFAAAVRKVATWQEQTVCLDCELTWRGGGACWSCEKPGIPFQLVDELTQKKINMSWNNPATWSSTAE